MASRTIPGTAAWKPFDASRAWKKVSGFCAVPRRTGRSGVSPRARCANTSSASTSARNTSSASGSIVATSCEVRNPSKKCRKGTRLCRVAAWAIAARSCASCTELDASIANPVPRQAMTSEWSPKIESACVASVRAATCMQNGVSSPAILYMFGIMSSRPCEAVKVVASAPACRAPCTAPAAPASDCISTTRGTSPHRFVRPSVDQWSASSPMVELGVIG